MGRSLLYVVLNGGDPTNFFFLSFISLIYFICRLWRQWRLHFISPIYISISRRLPKFRARNLFSTKGKGMGRGRLLSRFSLMLVHILRFIRPFPCAPLPNILVATCKKVCVCVCVPLLAITYKRLRWLSSHQLPSSWSSS